MFLHTMVCIRVLMHDERMTEHEKTEAEGKGTADSGSALRSLRRLRGLGKLFAPRLSVHHIAWHVEVSE